LWSGLDPEGPFLVQAQALLAEYSQRGAQGDDHGGEFAGLIMGDAQRPTSSLEIFPGVPFGPPERRVFTWDVALDADELIGLIGTFSWIITMPEQTRIGVIAEARRLLAELLGVEGDVTVDVEFRAEVWRSQRID
jgi:hypothetical protein